MEEKVEKLEKISKELLEYLDVAIKCIPDAYTKRIGGQVIKNYEEELESLGVRCKKYRIKEEIMKDE